MPLSNPNYWIGLQADGWPTFKWSDTIVPSPNDKGGYSNWGTFSNPRNPEQMFVPEPNNLRPTEYCAVGNNTQGTGKPFTWAWADTNCFNTYVSICRINRGCRSRPPLPPHAPCRRYISVGPLACAAAVPGALPPLDAAHH